MALVASALALIWPSWFTGTKAAIPWLLGAIMFGMGLTLTWGDFGAVGRRWRLVGVGLVAQYAIMPALGWGIGWVFGMPREVLAGFVLLGACPGGTASNVVTYLAKGNVALSVSMTLVSTICAPLLTPAITWLLASQRIEVPAFAMMQSIALIVILPLVAGLAVRLLVGRWVGRIVAGLPVFSMVAIVWVIAIVMALNQGRILAFPGLIVLGVVLHNSLGLALGYGAARLFTRDKGDCRALAVEVGMQNSGLAVALATQYLPAAAALPGALFSLWHNLSGAAFASFCTRAEPPARVETPAD